MIANVAWLLLLAFPASAAHVSRIWRTQDGLPENRVRALAQTPDGYLWIGTTGGLARFDGVRFVIYTRFNTAAMTEDNMRALTVSRDGSLWAATDGGGLLHVKNGRFQAFGPKEGLTTDFVASVLEDRSGNIWAATNRGLFRGANGRFVRMDTLFQLRNQAFFSLAETDDGHVLAGSQAGLLRVENGKLQPPPAEPEEVFRLRQTRAGALWMATNHGVRAIGNTPDLTPLQTKGIGAISEDRAGNVWVGTTGDGLYFYQAGRGQAQHLSESLPNATVLAILEDREAGVWAGTADGLVRLTEPDVSVIDRRDGLANENVLTVSCSPSGGVWLTTVTGGIYRYAQGILRPFHLPAPANDVRALGVFEDANGVQWFGSDSQGAVRLANGVATRFTMREGMRNNGIQFFHPDTDGSLWIGTTSGISRWNGTSFRNYYIEDGLAYGWVRAVANDANGDFLIGTDRGINRVRDGKFIHDPAFAQLSRDKVWSIYKDKSHTIWLGTRSGGLIRVRGNEVKRITTREGLLSNSIFQVLGAGDDRLWMSGPVGISSASLADLNAAADGKLESGRALSYRIGGGQESAQINGGVQNSGCVASDGEVWFPSVKGAIHFKSRRPPIRRHTPVRIEQILVDDQPLPASSIVAPGRHRLKIEFTSNSLRSPEAVTFRYRLEGYEKQWTTVTGPRFAEYDNLPPSDYRFQVVAHDESPGNNTSQASAAFTLEPYFYQTGWFYALVIIGAVDVVVAIVFLRERRARAEYALRLAERTRIAREMHDTLVQGCVGVSTLIEAAVGSARSDHDQMLECLDNARVHLRLTLDEARQALTDLRHDSFEGGLPAALEELTKSIKSPAVTFQVEGDPVPLPDVTNRALLLVTREAIRNAVTHGAPGSIEVSLLYGNAVLELDIQDNGRGFAPPESELANVGHFGVLGMRERMEQIGGTLEVASAPGAGTAVSARLPL